MQQKANLKINALGNCYTIFCNFRTSPTLFQDDISALKQKHYMVTLRQLNEQASVLKRKLKSFTKSNLTCKT